MKLYPACMVAGCERIAPHGGPGVPVFDTRLRVHLCAEHARGGLLIKRVEITDAGTTLHVAEGFAHA